MPDEPLLIVMSSVGCLVFVKWGKPILKGVFDQWENVLGLPTLHHRI